MLAFKDVAYKYRARGGNVGVSAINFSVTAGQVVALIGESGAGKSTICRLAAGFLQPQSGVVTRPAADNPVQMIFQSSSLSLSPHLSVFEIIAEGLRIRGESKQQVQQKVAEILIEVGLDVSFSGRYLHDLSGGQRQRVNIARALVLEPPVVIADEPVSALDVSVQAQVCNVMKPLVKKAQCAMLLVIHDIVLAEYLADHIVVLKNGQIVEQGITSELIGNPRSSYAQQLLEASGY